MKRQSIAASAILAASLLAIPSQSQAFFFGFGGGFGFHVGGGGWFHPAYRGWGYPGYYGWHHPYFGYRHPFYGLPYYAHAYGLRPAWRGPVIAAVPVVTTPESREK